MQVVKIEENSGEGNTINTLKPPTHPNSFRSLSMVTEGGEGLIIKHSLSPASLGYIILSTFLCMKPNVMK